MASKKKLKKRGWYTKKLDELAKRFAKERDKFICQKTGKHVTGCNAHGSHVVPVSAGMALRWDIENIICLGAYEHIYWWHKDPLAAIDWFKRRFLERYDYLTWRRMEKWSPMTVVLAEFYAEASKAETWQEYKAIYERHRYGAGNR